ncbi:hypothetical protein ATK17_3744 [Branchiibius hedensis]|uniref:Uncharacterized protein n=1 Tax=Branchiibius hedensis TaxID=672460 RepID=A0A2Y9BPE8_9MICO|nr:hypothetical protein [Branchiibius hedensis]PWJ23251.1 hypothetical protein ATK17_3744 [Branchiibius hedensis]SSA58940.1 hypothetical protein SAMN04489750_3744 [Branchiibius hedensis]
MSQPNPFLNDPDEDDDRSDPTSLPLFAEDADQPRPPRQGRVRSNFSLGENAPRRPGHIHAVGRDVPDDEVAGGLAEAALRALPPATARLALLRMKESTGASLRRSAARPPTS